MDGWMDGWAVAWPTLLFFQGCLCRHMLTPCPGLRIPRSRSDADTMCADGLPSYALAWQSALTLSAQLASPKMLSTRRHASLFETSVIVYMRLSHSDRLNQSGKHLVVHRGRHYGTGPGHRNLQAMSVGSACLTCLGNPCPGAAWVHVEGTQ